MEISVKNREVCGKCDGCGNMKKYSFFDSIFSWFQFLIFFFPVLTNLIVVGAILLSFYAIMNGIITIPVVVLSLLLFISGITKYRVSKTWYSKLPFMVRFLGTISFGIFILLLAVVD